MAAARFTATELEALFAEGWKVSTTFDDGAPRTIWHPDVEISLSASIDLRTHEPCFVARKDGDCPWWSGGGGCIIEHPSLARLLTTLRGLLDAWAADQRAMVLRDRNALLGGKICARGCGRPVAGGAHRPEDGNPLAGYCARCPQVARRRVRARGGDPDDLATLVAELRRKPTRGVKPGTDPRKDRTHDHPGR